ncbi:ArsR/SmtB family transcription factor [Aliiglaciecola sp. M165]|uniref:ArsR/SmtB family transcription factor n=1 Tax=Aliiglaciecola sp. M165 TaxID=2593649 RepID=UPI001180EDE4|nr:metalloregulator ArsR/SmtB family transcription factor [Aliiglaciecola sp. M165]TRY31046.1 helix-turn-helix transcriptional regulator [Aliiglaciecola sp. M165]
MHPNNFGIEKTFGALSDSTRIAIIERLSRGEVSLSELSKPFAMSQTAVSKHVKILSDAGLVAVKKRGRTRFCELLPEPMQQAENWLMIYQKFWSERFNNLSTFLQQENSQ